MINCAGILAYKYINDIPHFLLVHPGGPFWINKDLESWSIPKGHVNDGEALFDAAKREFEEELGIKFPAFFIDLRQFKSFKQNKNKILNIWLLEVSKDWETNLKLNSNLFDLEFPVKSGNFIKVPGTVYANCPGKILCAYGYKIQRQVNT